MKTNFGKNQKNLIRKILNLLSNLFAKGNKFQSNQAKKLLKIVKKNSKNYDGKYFDFYTFRDPSKNIHDKNLINFLSEETIQYLTKKINL